MPSVPWEDPLKVLWDQTLGSLSPLTQLHHTINPGLKQNYSPIKHPRDLFAHVDSKFGGNYKPVYQGQISQYFYGSVFLKQVYCFSERNEVEHRSSHCSHTLPDFMWHFLHFSA